MYDHFRRKKKARGTRYPRGTELIWTPGYRDAVKYTDSFYDAIYYSGHDNIRGRSTIYITKLDEYRIVINTRITLRVVL